MVYKLEQGRPVRPGETGILSDGRAVSGYERYLDANPDVAAAEGYYPMEGSAPPEYDGETEYITDSYAVAAGKIVQTWVVHNIEGGDDA